MSGRGFTGGCDLDHTKWERLAESGNYAWVEETRLLDRFGNRGVGERPIGRFRLERSVLAKVALPQREGHPPKSDIRLRWDVFHLETKSLEGNHRVREIFCRYPDT